LGSDNPTTKFDSKSAIFAIGHAVSLFADALSTVHIRLRQRSLSPVLQVIHALLVALPEFRVFGIHVFEDQVFGRINVLGDAANRGLFDIIFKVTRQIAAVNVADASLAQLS